MRRTMEPAVVLLRRLRDLSLRAAVIGCTGFFCQTYCFNAEASDSDRSPVATIEQTLSSLRDPQGEVTGDSWGWDLRQYPNIVGAYTLANRLLILTARDTDHQLLIEPLTGKLLKLDGTQANNFRALADHLRQPISLDSYTGKAASVESAGSIGSGTFSCTLNFTSSFQANNLTSGRQASFYIVVRDDKPQVILNRSCSDSGKVIPHTFISTLSEVDEVDFVSGPDDSIWLLVVMPGLIIRLDRDFQLHNPLHGSVVTVKSEAVDPMFSAAVENTLASRERAMETAVAQSAAPPK